MMQGGRSSVVAYFERPILEVILRFLSFRIFYKLRDVNIE